MSFIEKSLSRGEVIQARFRIHPMAWLGPILWFVLGILTGPGLLLFGVIAISQALKLMGFEHALTNKRIAVKFGVLSKTTNEIWLKAVETVEIHQGILGSALNYGTVSVSGRGTTKVFLHNVENPMAVKRAIEDLAAGVVDGAPA